MFVVWIYCCLFMEFRHKPLRRITDGYWYYRARAPIFGSSSLLLQLMINLFNFYMKLMHCTTQPAKQNSYFFQYGGGLTLRIFLRSKWLLDLPDLGIFLGILDFFNGKNNILPKCLFLLKKWFLDHVLFFFHTRWVGWVGLGK